MAQYAPVAPLHLLQELKDENLLGNYHLLLAHEVVADPHSWQQLFVEEGNEDMFIIMDNSTVELGYPVAPEILQEACEIVDASCVVLPDYMNDGEKTRAASLQAPDDWADAHLPPFMCVAQGNSFSDYMVTVSTFAKELRPKYWCVPKCAGDSIAPRLTLIQSMWTSLMQEGIYTEPFIHLLGFTDDTIDDIASARHPLVMGIDSAVPVRMGQENKLLNPLVDQDMGSRGDFFEDKKPLTARAVHNIDAFRRWINLD